MDIYMIIPLVMMAMAIIGIVLYKLALFLTKFYIYMYYPQLCGLQGLQASTVYLFRVSYAAFAGKRTNRVFEWWIRHFFRVYKYKFI